MTETVHSETENQIHEIRVLSGGTQQQIEDLHRKIDALHDKVNHIVTAVEGALNGLQNNPMLRAFTGGK